MDASSRLGEGGYSASVDFAGPDCVEIPGLVVTYLRVAEQVAALLPTPSFTEDLDRRRRAVARFVWTLDPGPRERLRSALTSADIEVSAWWDAANPAAGIQPPKAAAG